MRDVFQMTENGNLVGTMTVRDNIHFRQLLFRSGKGIADGGHTVDSKRLEDEPLVRAFELEGHLDKKVAELSTGLRKRVGIVAGMLFDPHVIMLDEPSNAIDPITRARCSSITSTSFAPTSALCSPSPMTSNTVGMWPTGSSSLTTNTSSRI